MTLPFLQLSGDAYEQGRQHGRSLAAEIEHNINVYFDRFEREGGLTRDEVLERSYCYATAIAANNAAYAAGMDGIAVGALRSHLEIVALNVRYEILYYQYTVNQMARTDGCTAFAASPLLTENGRLIVGQNWDWIPDVRGAIVSASHADGTQVLGFTEAGIFGAKIGLNSHGLGLAINGMVTTEDDWKRLGKPFHVRCYEVLAQRELADAMGIVMEDGRACSANYLIAQSPASAVNVESAPSVVSPSERDWPHGCLVHTNHFVDPDSLGVTEPPDEYRIFSHLRRERLQAMLRRNRPLRMKDLMRYLSDHANAPRSICRHEEPDAPIDEQYRTVTSVVMDLHEGTLLASDGPPCVNHYDRYSLADKESPG